MNYIIDIIVSLVVTTAINLPFYFANKSMIRDNQIRDEQILFMLGDIKGKMERILDKLEESK